MEGGFNFDTVEATAQVEAGVTWSPWWALALLALWLGAIGLSIFLGGKLGAQASQKFRLSALPAPAQLCLLLLGACLLLAQGLGAGTAYMQTQIINDSTSAYFGYVSVARLLGLSHSHIFGFTVCFGYFALLASFCEARQPVRLTLVAVALLAGPFDIAAWWGIKYVNAAFHWVSAVTGTSAVLACAVTILLVLRSLMPRFSLARNTEVYREEHTQGDSGLATADV